MAVFPSGLMLNFHFGRYRYGQSHGVSCGLTLLVTLLLLAGCSRKPANDPDLLAKVGSREIRSAEFQDAMKRRAVGNEPKQKEALLEEMVGFETLVQRAQDLGLDRDPELRRSWENLLVTKLRERQLEPTLTNAVPTREQVRQYYEANPTNFTEVAQRKGAILFLEFPAKSDSDRRQKIRQHLAEGRDKAIRLIHDLPDTRGFGAVAIEYSEDQATRYRGGDLGWLEEGRGDARFDPKVAEILFALAKPGDFSDVIETPRGGYVVRLLDLRPRRVKPLESVEAAIQHKLLFEGRQRLETEWKQQARAAYKVELFPDALRQVQAPSGGKPEVPQEPPGLP